VETTLFSCETLDCRPYFVKVYRKSQLIIRKTRVSSDPPEQQGKPKEQNINQINRSNFYLFKPLIRNGTRSTNRC
jgi:hypothetical protein